MVARNQNDETIFDLIRDSSFEQLRKEQLVYLLIESAATQKDDAIMKELFIEMMHKNAALNRTLEEKLQEVERLSVTDQLTGLYNRRKFKADLREEIVRGVRYGRGFSLIMLDIDHFKSINDEFGHDVGDDVLRRVSTILQDRVRTMDVPCRWGGEEFMVLLPETNDADAVVVAEDLRRRFEAEDFGLGRPVTCSFGVVEWISGATDDDMTKRVDEALYTSKENGRNQVTIVGIIIEQPDFGL